MKTAQYLISLPPLAVESFYRIYNRSFPRYIASSDPPGTRLGSGGGTAQLLVDAWKKTDGEMSFPEWLDNSCKIIMHAGGKSRRLPAYALNGKVGIPIPIMCWMHGHRLDQTLLDMQQSFLTAVAEKASTNTVAMVASGDVLLRCACDKLPQLPDADVVLVGLCALPGTAQNHGVFFCDRADPGHLMYALQKPSVEEIRSHAVKNCFFIDSGLWLFSARAIAALMVKCGWDEKRQDFRDGQAAAYDLYGRFSRGLGEQPLQYDDTVGSLSCAVLPLPCGEFYHFGTNRDMIQSCARLENIRTDKKEFGSEFVKPHSEMFALNSPTRISALTPHNRLLWIENAAVGKNWHLESEHVITGVPRNDWSIWLPKGICLDFVPVDYDDWCIRVYGFDDPFRGGFFEKETSWCGQPAMKWFKSRGISVEDAAIDIQKDIHDIPLFPVVRIDNSSGEFVQWLIECRESNSGYRMRKMWLSAERLSAEKLSARVNIERLFTQRKEFINGSLPTLARNAARNVFYLLDLDHTARQYAATTHAVAAPETDAGLMGRIHHAMFRAAVGRYRNEQGWEAYETEAFGNLRRALIDSIKERAVTPHSTVLDDQIVWARSPVRVDLAGGWTDTPPFCLLYGGRVVNVALNLNSQPPIQVFARRTDKLELVIRSIDQGDELRVKKFEELQTQTGVGSTFSIAKVALGLAGFDTNFSSTSHKTLNEMLDDFGGGIELSLLAAVPKGSGLGTSSILAATIFGALSNLCGLEWDHTEIYRRVLVLEQMLTTGGGWQDQVGGISRGLKYVITDPGVIQNLQICWLPDHLFSDPESHQCMLLYYTGVTRIAKNILQEIVRGMFLNRKKTNEILQEMRHHARWTNDQLIRGSYQGLCEGIKKSWELNQRLESGANPPSIKAILHKVGDLCAAAKLAGAGGGGYLFMLAKDQNAALRIRNTLVHNPPNTGARFVDLQLSTKGMEITRS